MLSRLRIAVRATRRMDGETTYKEKTKDISPSPPSSGPTVRDNRRDCCATTSIGDLGFTGYSNLCSNF